MDLHADHVPVAAPRNGPRRSLRAGQIEQSPAAPARDPAEGHYGSAAGCRPRNPGAGLSGVGGAGSKDWLTTSRKRWTEPADNVTQRRTEATKRTASSSVKQVCVRRRRRRQMARMTAPPRRSPPAKTPERVVRCSASTVTVPLAGDASRRRGLHDGARPLAQRRDHGLHAEHELIRDGHVSAPARGVGRAQRQFQVSPHTPLRRPAPPSGS
jgi:hypothetical protein